MEKGITDKKIVTLLAACGEGILQFQSSLLLNVQALSSVRVVADLPRLQLLYVLDASSFDHFNVHIMDSYQNTSNRQSTYTDKTVGGIKARYISLRESRAKSTSFTLW